MERAKIDSPTPRRKSAGRCKADACLQRRPLLYSTGLFFWAREKRLPLSSRTVLGRLERLERRP